MNRARAVPVCGTANGPPPNNDVCESENACIGRQPGEQCGAGSAFVCENVTPAGYTGICCRCYANVPALSPWGIAMLAAALLGVGLIMMRRRFRARPLPSTT